MGPIGAHILLVESSLLDFFSLLDSFSLLGKPAKAMLIISYPFRREVEQARLFKGADKFLVGAK
jgi:hypothetical protein